jgi:hypothetical protein
MAGPYCLPQIQKTPKGNGTRLSPNIEAPSSHRRIHTGSLYSLHRFLPSLLFFFFFFFFLENMVY